MKKLYVIPTPIGNLKDISENIKEALGELEVLFCEDTRVTSKLLGLIGIRVPKLVSYNNNNENERVELIKETFENNDIVGIVSDAGAPTISDPGYVIVDVANELGIQVSPISGPSSVINFLMGSGISYESFSFHSFSPRKKSELISKLINSRNNEFLILFESPNRIEKTLTWINEEYPLLKLVVGRELTKTYETFYRGTASEILKNLKPKGEFILGVKWVEEKQEFTDKQVKLLVEEEISNGSSKKESIKKVADKNGLSKNEVYKIYHEN